MSLKSKPYFWVECDHEGCAERCPSEDYEVNAWDSKDDALDAVAYDDWTTTDAGKHYCIGHAPDEEDVPDLSGLDEFAPTFAAELRTAAKVERAEWGDWGEAYPKAAAVHLALADWLEHTASLIDGNNGGIEGIQSAGHALSTARAILGGAS